MIKEEGISPLINVKAFSGLREVLGHLEVFKKQWHLVLFSGSRGGDWSKLELTILEVSSYLSNFVIFRMSQNLNL